VEDDIAERPLEADVVRVLVEHHRSFLAFVEKRVGQRELAEDLLQSAFARGLEKLPAVESEDSAIAWFYRVLRNAVVDHYRRGGARGRALERLAHEVEGHEAPSPELRDAVCRCVAQLAETLKPEYAEALRRVELEGQSVQAYAEAAGITANNAAVRVFRARAALRGRVSRSCGTCAEHGCLDCTCGAPRGGAPT
jgi:RNA polymerase sigma factor (sigma-70 family)